MILKVGCNGGAYKNRATKSETGYRHVHVHGKSTCRWQRVGLTFMETKYINIFYKYCENTRHRCDIQYRISGFNCVVN